MSEPLPDVERQPDEMTAITVEGGEVMTYSFGSGDKVLFLANGGPGLALRLLCATATATWPTGDGVS